MINKTLYDIFINLECIQKKLRSLKYNKLKFINCTLIFHLNHFDVNKKNFSLLIIKAILILMKKNIINHFDINQRKCYQPFLYKSKTIYLISTNNLISVIQEIILMNIFFFGVYLSIKFCYFH